jgi:hypothetical protein
MTGRLDLRRGRSSPSGGVGGSLRAAGCPGARKGDRSSVRRSGSDKRASRVGAFLALLALALISIAPAQGAPAVPVPTAPGDGATFAFLPAFGWSPVAGADRYEFEIAADPGFNAPVLGSQYDHFFTKNTRATLTKVVPNGTYWWHVQAVAADGAVSGWSAAQSFTRNWASSPDLTAPADGATITFPAQPFRLAWTAVPGAAKYSVSVATDPSLASLIGNGNPVVTQATSFTLASPLAPSQTYYWGITPLDAGGNPGSPSAISSFTWVWPSETTLSVTDVASAPEIEDYEFSWTTVPGAAGYEVEINTSEDFAAGSWVCCPVNPITHLTTIGTTYSPTLVLPNNNSYYWRVRAVDASGNPGVWNLGPQFSKGFDEVLPPVKNLRMLDNSTPGEGPFETSTPIVKWDPVPGASAYEVEVTRFASGCQWTANTEHWRNIKTATAAWTPLGSGWNGIKPFESPLNVSTDIPALVAGHDYCVRVTALDRPASLIDPYVRGVETYLPAPGIPAFTYLGPPAGAPCTEPCDDDALGSGDYLTPITGTTQAAMPYFRWEPIAGFQSYFVLVSKDPNFTNLVDYAFTQANAYAPRTGAGPRTYPDETNLYYWAVLPATEANGGGVTTAPQFSHPSNFHKQSVPPTLLSPANGAVFNGPVRFRWTPTEGARRYRLQVSMDPSFSNFTGGEDLVTRTDSTTYTSSVTYRADTALYWRVRAEDEELRGLAWSAVGTFRKTLPAPVPSASNPTGGDAVPSWSWAPVPGAVSYDFRLYPPNNTTTPFNFFDIPSNVATPTLLKGTGIWKWQARAKFPQVDLLNHTAGPWSPLKSFTRTITQPAAPEEQIGQRLVLLRWEPKSGVMNYRVQISTRADFSQPLFDAPATTDNPSYSPWLNAFAYSQGGTFYWRVAAADDIGVNVGDYTATRSFTLSPFGTSTKASSSISALVTKTTARVKVRGSVFPSHPGKTVTVTLYKKKNGVWVKLRTKAPTLTASSAYSTRFGRPSAGACKVRAIFGGDADHLASSKTVGFRC